MRAAPFAGGLRRRLDAIVILACIAFALAATWVHGADMNWDLHNYHIYSAFSFVKGRLHAEFMAAGMMSYLNPLPMLPLYGMLAAGWHGLAIGMVLGLLHSANLVLLWLICRRLFGKLDWPVSFALLAMLIGAASPLFIIEISTSFADISTCIPVLGGVLVLLGAPTRGRLLAGGALLGAAVGLKRTNRPFALAAAAFVFVPGTSWRQRGVNLCWLALGGLVGGVLTGGYWAWMLYREFHNPVFPFANSLFRSPDFPAIGHIHRRFLPGSLWEALAVPFHLAIPKDTIYVEVTAPDLRFALCAMAGVAALLLALRGRKAHAGDGVATGDAMRPRFLGYMALGWTLWLVQFGNGRYFLPLSLLIGPALVIVLATVLSARRALLAAAVCAFLQLGNMYMTGLQTFGATGTWDRRMIQLDMPRKLMERPYLYLSMDAQTNSYLAPFVHPQSRFMNVDGMMPLDVVGPGAERVKEQLARFQGATRMLVPILASPAHVLAKPDFVRALDADLNRFGLRTDTSDCVSIVNPAIRNSITVVGADEAAAGIAAPFDTLLSCALVPAQPDPALQAARARAAQLFDKIEQACPHQFPARWNGVVMRSRNNFFWTRFYVDTDLFLHAGDKQVYVQAFKLPIVALGTPAGLMSGSERIPCERIRWRVPVTGSVGP
jgi:hypothetical protein